MGSDALNLRLAACVVLATTLLLLTRLGGTDLWDPDEPRIGQVTRELRSMTHGATDLVVLRLNDEVYTQKPPLYYWLGALASAPAGAVEECSVRLPSALAGIAVVALVLGWGSRVLGGAPALLGAALLLTTPSFAGLARRAQFDVVLTLFEMLALVGFWRLDRKQGSRTRNLGLLHGAMGLAILTKGPVGFLVPMLIIAAYLAWERRLRDFAAVVPLRWLALSLGPGLIWLAAVAALTPAGFLGEAVGSNVFGRFFEGTSHTRPFYYYLYQLPVELLPWTLLLPTAWTVARSRVFVAEADPDRTRAWRFLLAWIGASFFFFSLSSGKRGLYLLPSFPAAALIFADALWDTLMQRTQLPRSLLVAAAIVAVAIVGCGITIGTLGSIGGFPIPRMVGLSLVGIVAAGAAAFWRTRRRESPGMTQLGVLLGSVFVLQFTAYVYWLPALNAEKSLRPIAEAVSSLTTPGEPVGLVRNRPKLAGIAFYADRRIVPLTDGEDLRRFVDSGGRVIVAQTRKLVYVEDAAAYDVRFRARGGKREMVVAVVTELKKSPGDDATTDPLSPH